MIMEQYFIKLNERKNKLQKMLAIQSSLQKRKVELAKQRGTLVPKESVEKDTIMDEETQKIYHQIYPILQDIHKEEVRILELKEQIELSTINKEMDYLREGLQKVCEHCVKDEGESSYSQLCIWAKELKQTVKTESSEVLLTDVYYSSNPPKATNRNTELLSFLASHQDFFVKITIEIHSISFPSGSPPEVHITSDPYIPALETVGKESFIKHISIQPLLNHLTETISKEILPFL